MNILELFAGSRSVGNAAMMRGHKVFSSDINDFDGIDYVTDIRDFRVGDVPFIPDMIWASPPCTYFSVASIGHHWNRDNTPKTSNAMLGVELVRATLHIIECFKIINENLVWYMENPRGKLRKLDIVAGLDRETVCYCQYGDTRMKPTDIWSNNIRSLLVKDGWQPRPMCFNGNPNCHHEPAPRGSRTGTQGLKGNYERSKIPSELVTEIIIATENALTGGPK